MQYTTTVDRAIYHLEVFEGVQEQKTIVLEEGKQHYYLVIVMGHTNLDLRLQTHGVGAHLQVHCLCIAQAGKTIKMNMQAQLGHSHSAAHLHIVTLLLEGSNATVHGGVTIVPGITKAEGRLLEENIVLGKKVKIHTLPQLDVRSNDVMASHGARIEKLDEQKLFYLESKGISKQEAKRLMIEGYVEQMFSLIESEKSKFESRIFDNLRDEVMSRLLEKF